MTRRDDGVSQSQPKISRARSPDEASQVSQSQAPGSLAGSPDEASQVSQSQPEFPIHVLPNSVLGFVLEAAQALLIDPAVIAGICLATLAGCVGNRRRIIVNPGAWYEPAILWIVLVLPSGARKTPALNAVLGYLQEREAQEIEDEKARLEEYEEEKREWQAVPEGKRGEQPEKPELAQRLLVSDTTTEALLAVHANNPLGVLLYRDELGAWLRSFNQYKGGKGADAQTWCEMHQGKPALIDRKGALTLSVPRAAVSIAGGIQPELLRNALAGEHLFDGIAARLLFISPEEQLKRWTDDTISDEAREEWATLLNELLALQADPEGDPIDLPMTNEAKAVWVRYYNDHAKRETEEEGPLRSALSKLEGATARFALVIQLAEDPKSKAVDIDAMEAGIEISDWFEDQARRVYRAIDAGQRVKERRELVEWIEKRGGRTTTRELARLGPYKFRNRAQEALDELVTEGQAKRKQQTGKKGVVYVLCASTNRKGVRK